MKSTGAGSHLPHRLARTRAACLELRGAEEARRRAAEIARLPTVTWKGQTLYTLRCRGDYGRGPHDVNLPEMWLWALLDLRAFICPWHCR